MKKLVIGICLLAPSLSFAFGSVRDSGSEYYDTKRCTEGRIVQPKATRQVMGLCASVLPFEQSYGAQVTELTCGATQPQLNTRLPIKMSPQQEDAWDTMLHSGMSDASERAQVAAQQEAKWSGSIPISMTEHWTYQKMVGDCAGPTETYATTCYQDQEESYDCSYEVDDYTTQCTPDPEPSPSYGGGSDYSAPSGGGSYGGGDTGAGEDLGGTFDGSMNEYVPTPINEVLQDIKRGPAGCSQVRTGSHTVAKTCWRGTTRKSWSCTQRRPSWKTWLQTTDASRACKQHVVKYDLELTKDKNWAPGYVDSKHPEYRSYNDILPNKWDLLPGEKEEIFVSGNQSESTTLNPGVSIQNGMNNDKPTWNEYDTSDITPRQFRCQYGMQPSFKMNVQTIGRNFQTAPNPLKLASEPLLFTAGKARPNAMSLVDIGRATRLQAAEAARNNRDKTNGKGMGAYQDNGTPLKGSSASGGYYQETRFKMRMIRKDKWGREVRVTIPNTFTDNLGDIVGDSIIVSLEGKNGLDRFYRPGGPMEKIFGGLYKRFGVEVTPGEEYMVVMQTVSRGLPFYESGCKGGKAICQGEEASEEAYSEPIAIPFTADRNIDNRSWFKKFKDWQEKFLLF